MNSELHPLEPFLPANARILLAENQTLYLGSGRRCGDGMIAFLGRPFSVTDAYFRMLL